MSRKSHPADDATLQAIHDAAYFRVSLFRDGQIESHALSSLPAARRVAELLPTVRQSPRRAVVYAVTKAGRSFMIPSNFPAPMESDMQHAPTPAPEAGLPAAEVDIPSRSYTDRSNCRKAMKRHAAEQGEPIENFEVIGSTPNFKFQRKPTTATPAATANNLSIPDFLDRTNGKTRRGPGSAATAAPQPAPSQAPQQEQTMPKTKTKAQARRPTTKAERTRYDWKGAKEAAERGTLPKKPDFSAATHERFRPALKEVAAMAAAGDLKELQRFKWDGFVSSSAKAVLKYRDLCVLALKAKNA